MRCIVKFTTLASSIMLAAGCMSETTREDGEYIEFKIAGNEFRVPQKQVRSSEVGDVSSGANIFIRIESVSGDFHIVHAGRSYRHERTEKGNPYVPFVTNSINSDEVSHLIDGTEVQCMAGGDGIRFGCGIRLNYKETIWGILFDHEDLDKASDIKSDAISLLESYEN